MIQKHLQLDDVRQSLVSRSPMIMTLLIQLLLPLPCCHSFHIDVPRAPLSSHYCRDYLHESMNSLQCSYSILYERRYSRNRPSDRSKRRLWMSERVNDLGSVDYDGDNNNNEKEEALDIKMASIIPPKTTNLMNLVDKKFGHQIDKESSDDDHTTHGIPTNSGASSRLGDAMKRLGSSIGQPTVWTEFSRLQLQKQQQQEEVVCNLGQGFPNWLPPSFAIDSIIQATTSSSTLQQQNHQYTRPAGHPNLVQQLSKRYAMHLHRPIDPYHDIAVTVGASQALYLSLQTILNQDDEVILFEPFFDLYVNQIRLAGGTPVYAPLDFVPYNDDDQGNSGGSWMLNATVFQQKLTNRTKAIILNSPHNPTGKVFTAYEMELIATIIQQYAPANCIVLSDEVYKYIVHAPPTSSSSSSSQPLGIAEQQDVGSSDSFTKSSSKKLHCTGHTHFATIPGMYNRTITVSSAGKTFSATGWQIGWCIGPRHLISPIQQLLPYVQFCASTIMQEALAQTLKIADLPYQGYASYYDYLRSMYIKKRNLLSTALQQAGIAVPDYSITPGGGFFIFARISDAMINACVPAERINVPNIAAPGGIARKDWAFCEWMLEEMNLLCIPSSPFFSHDSIMMGKADHFIRIAFCKTDDTIEQAARILLQLNSIMKQQQNNYDNIIIMENITANAEQNAKLDVKNHRNATLVV